MENKVLYCKSCGAALNVELNRPFIYCIYCGTKNIIEDQQMRTDITMGNVRVKAQTSLESMLASAQYAFQAEQYDKANEILMAVVMSGVADHRVYLLKARIDLMMDKNGQLFEDIRALQRLEARQSARGEVTAAVLKLMQCRGKNGVSALHNATFHEDMEMVKYCVEHGADVNLVAGMNRVTPISIMFVPVSAKLSRLDGTPFVRNKQKVKEIRRYLMQHGAHDVYRMGF